MPKVLRMPNLPRRPRRNLVVLLFFLYKEACRPSLEVIADQIQREDRDGTASRETIRRLLLGKVVPANWNTVETVFSPSASSPAATPTPTGGTTATSTVSRSMPASG
jgi:hypothetical protein